MSAELEAEVARLRAACLAAAEWHEARDRSIGRGPQHRRWTRVQHQEQSRALRDAVDPNWQRADPSEFKPD